MFGTQAHGMSYDFANVACDQDFRQASARILILIMLDVRTYALTMWLGAQGVNALSKELIKRYCNNVITISIHSWRDPWSTPYPAASRIASEAVSGVKCYCPCRRFEGNMPHATPHVTSLLTAPLWLMHATGMYGGVVRFLSQLRRAWQVVPF